jgi:hypothetical protein
MTILDAIILTISALLAAIAVGVGRGMGLAFIVFIGFAINEWAITHLNVDSWDAFYATGAEWMAMVVAVDLLIIAALAIRQKRSEVWLILVFGASAIFHLFCRLEFLGADETPLYDIRFNFVKIIAALQIAGVIINITGGNWRGGKLVKLRLHRLNFYSRRANSNKAFKVKR